MAPISTRVKLAALATLVVVFGTAVFGTAKAVPYTLLFRTATAVPDAMLCGAAKAAPYETLRSYGGRGFSHAAAIPSDRSHAGAEDLPRRIVSLVPATTEMLFAMGAGNRIAGVSNYDRFPPEAARLPKVGGLLDPDVETLLSLKPDLVIVYDTQADLKRQLERAQVPMYHYAHRGLPDITETMRALGARIGAKTAADAAATRIEQQLAAVGRRVAGRSRPSTLLVFGREQGTMRRVHASGGYGFLHDVLELAGGTDVLNDLHKQSVEMSTEMILTRRPEVILELHYGDSLKPAAMDAERLVWNALPSLPAVRNKRVYLLAGDEFVVPGPRIVVAAERFARTLHPEAFN
jgi:iron complex transport system substrate-binding protein